MQLNVFNKNTPLKMHMYLRISIQKKKKNSVFVSHIMALVVFEAIMTF